MVCSLLAGRAADLLGRRRVFVSGSSRSPAPCSRAAWRRRCPRCSPRARDPGLAAATVVPAALALLTDTFPDREQRTRALAVWTAAAASGGAIGFLIGGVVTDVLGWRWIFLLNVPIALAAAALAPRVLAERRDDGPRRLDLRKIAGAVRRPGIAQASAVAFVLTSTTGGAGVLVTTYLQDVLDHPPATAGLLFLPFSVVVALGSLLGPRIVAATSERVTVAIGLAIVAVGLLVLTRPTPAPAPRRSSRASRSAARAWRWASVAATGIGMGAAAEDEQGLAAGVLNTATQLGTAVGVAAFGLVASAGTASSAVDGAVCPRRRLPARLVFRIDAGDRRGGRLGGNATEN